MFDWGYKSVLGALTGPGDETRVHPNAERLRGDTKWQICRSHSHFQPPENTKVGRSNIQHFHTRVTLDTHLTLTSSPISSPIQVELIQLTHSSLNLKANINVEFLSSAQL